MTPERLAEVLEALADGPPWNTAWLRSLLPELAVRGRLVAQEAGDIQGALRRVEETKQSLIESGELPKPRALGKTLDKVSGVIPDHWSATPLSLALEFDLTDGDWVESKDQDPLGEVRLTQLADVGSGEFRDRSDRHLTAHKAAELRCTFLEPNDVLIARLPDPLGRACLFPGDSKPCVTVVDVAIGRSRSAALIPTYLVLAMNSPIMLEIVETFATGTTRKRISTGNLRKTCIPLPPLAEQHRIVAKVDELMGHAAVVEARHLAASSARVRFRDAALHALAEAEDHEAVEAAWSRIEDHFEDLFTEPEDIQPLRQTILQLAVRGRLVAQEAGDEDEVLVASLRDLESGLSAAELKRYPCLSESLDQEDDLPSGWLRYPLRFGVSQMRNGLVTKQRKVGPGEMVSRIETIAEGTVDLSRVGYADLNEQEMEKYLLTHGDVLFSHINSPVHVGKTAIWDGSERLFHGMNLLLLRPAKHVLPTWMSVFLSELWQSGYWLKTCKQAVNQASVNQGDVGSVMFRHPPLAEQHRIVAKVDELMALCDTLETSLERAKTAREQFATSISHALTTPESILA